MRIGITGATGFIGNEIATLALAQEHQAIRYSRNPTTSMRAYDGNAAHTVDYSNLDALVHLAGESIVGRWTKSRKKAIRTSRIDATRQLVEGISLAENGPKTLVCASAIGYYGDTENREVNELSARGEGFLAEVCEDWEEAASLAVPHGIRVVHARFGMVLGRAGGAYPLMERIFSMGLGGRLGDGQQWMSWIDVRDAARLLLHACQDSRADGALNVVSDNPVRNEEFTRILAASLGRKALLPVPGFAVKMALGGMSELVLSSQRVEPAKARMLGFEWKYPTLEECLGSLEEV